MAIAVIGIGITASKIASKARYIRICVYVDTIGPFFAEKSFGPYKFTLVDSTLFHVYLQHH
jgi:hypothetical protein